MTRPEWPRILMGLSLLLCFTIPVRTGSAEGLAHPRNLSALFDLSFLVSPTAIVLIGIAYLISVVSFVLRIRQGLAGLCAFFLLALAVHLGEAQWPRGSGHNNGAMLPGAALAAYLIAYAFTRREPASIEACAGIVAAAYSLAGLSKLTGSGLLWAHGSNVAIHIATHSQSGADSLRDFRLFVADSPVLCTALGAGTLAIECTFFVYVWRKARKPYALAATAMHGGISLLMGLHHYDWLLMAIGVAFLPAARAASARADYRNILARSSAS